MADVKISALTAVVTPATSDVVPVVQGGVTKQETVAQIRTVIVPVAVATEVSGLGTGVATFLATPSGANLASALTTALPDTKGGTGITALGAGVATFLGTPSGANLGTALTSALAAAKVVQATGTGFPHVTAGALDAASVKVDTTDATHVTVPATANGVVTSSGTVLQQAANVLAGSSFVSIGTSPAAAGGVRLANNLAVSARRADNAIDIQIAVVNSSNQLHIGDVGQSTNIYDSFNNHYLRIGTNDVMIIGASSVACAQPVVGDSVGSPFDGGHGMFVKAMAGSTYTLAASEYALGTIKVTGSGANIIKLPAATDAASYRKFVWNAGSSTLAVQDTNSVAAAATLAAGTGAWFLFANAAVKQLSAAFTVA